MKTFHCTFGSDHLGGFGLFFHVVVQAPDEISARFIMNEAFDGKWCGIYPPELNYPEKYGTQALGRLVFDHISHDNTKVYYQVKRF